MCKIIAIANQKCGVTKTTTTVNLGIGLANHGKRMLLVDADAQGSFTAILGYGEPDSMEVNFPTVLEKLAQGVDLSFLTQEEQAVLYDVMTELSVIPSMLQSAEIKALSKEGAFDVMAVRAVLAGEVKPKKRNVTIRSDRIKEYFSDDYSEQDITKVILELLEEWKARKEDV